MSCVLSVPYQSAAVGQAVPDGVVSGTLPPAPNSGGDTLNSPRIGGRGANSLNCRLGVFYIVPTALFIPLPHHLVESRIIFEKSKLSEPWVRLGISVWDRHINCHNLRLITPSRPLPSGSWLTAHGSLLFCKGHLVPFLLRVPIKQANHRLSIQP